jgi:hypothetical protein
VFPFWDKQKRLLKILNKDRKQCHLDLKNKNPHMKEFQSGDLVIMQEQVKISVGSGISAKLMIRTRGPYQVLKKLEEGTSYRIQKLPLTVGQGQPGKVLKEATARMEVLPSQLIIAKKADRVDMRLAQLDQPMVTTHWRNSMELINLEHTTKTEPTKILRSSGSRTYGKKKSKTMATAMKKQYKKKQQEPQQSPAMHR